MKNFVNAFVRGFGWAVEGTREIIRDFARMLDQRPLTTGLVILAAIASGQALNKHFPPPWKTTEAAAVTAQVDRDTTPVSTYWGEKIRRAETLEAEVAALRQQLERARVERDIALRTVDRFQAAETRKQMTNSLRSIFCKSSWVDVSKMMLTAVRDILK